MIVWSYGGGVQTAGIAVLIREGALPRPDITVIADTGRERKTTWAYLREVIQPYLEPLGIKVEVAPHALSRVDLFATDGMTPMPVWTEEGRLSSFCSGEWKRDVVERYLRSRGVKECVNWLGYSLDEIHRATGKAHRPWCVPAYPLIDKRLTRQGCLRIVEAAGLPRPPKSRCYQCPHQTAEEWQEVRDDPEEWAKAVAIDDEIRLNDPLGKPVFLHRSRVPLAMADLSNSGDDLPLFRSCQEAGCYT